MSEGTVETLEGSAVTPEPDAPVMPNFIGPDAAAFAAEAQERGKKAIMVEVRIKQFGTGRKVGAEQVEVDCEKALLKVTKRILDGAETQAIKTLVGKVRAYMNDIEEGGEDGDDLALGLYMVPLRRVPVMDEKLVAWQGQFYGLVDVLRKAYEDLIESDRKRLGVLFREKNYPNVEDVVAKYRFTYRYYIQDAPLALKEVNAAIFNRERAKAADQWQRAKEASKAMLREEALEWVKGFREKLTGLNKNGKPKKVADKYIERFEAFLAEAQVRDISDDEGLKQILEQAKAVMEGADANDLQDANFRQQVANGFAPLVENLDQMVVQKKARKIKLDDSEQPADDEVPGMPEAVEAAAEQIAAAEEERVLADADARAEEDVQIRNADAQAEAEEEADEDFFTDDLPNE